MSEGVCVRGAEERNSNGVWSVKIYRALDEILLQISHMKCSKTPQKSPKMPQKVSLHSFDVAQGQKKLQKLDKSRKICVILAIATAFNLHKMLLFTRETWTFFSFTLSNMHFFASCTLKMCPLWAKGFTKRVKKQKKWDYLVGTWRFFFLFMSSEESLKCGTRGPLENVETGIFNR